ncbi:MAG: hypothetical protein P9L92_02835 [Candidatus Electryonea clarkiae]|nr:hypothetical protein [Candidatus Electryonea clarkiae]MDP8288817.1 hypothetical protein [Candidatus Electryonea clarkiae]
MPVQNSVLSRIAWIGAASLFLLTIIAAFLPPDWRLWGLDGFAFCSMPRCFISVCLITLLSIVTFIILNRYKNISGNYKFNPGLILISTLIIIIFLYPSATLLRGDGQLLINHLNIGKPASFRSPLYAQLVGLIYKAGFQFNVSPRGIYIFIDVLAMALFAGAILRFSNRFSGLSPKIFAIITGLFTGTLPLLFGLVEHYAILHAVIAWSIVFTLEAIDLKRFPWIGLILNIVAVGFHISAVIFMPAFLIPLLKNKKSVIQWSAFWLTGVMGFIIALLFFRKHLLAPFGMESADNYSLFSLAHIFDLINLDFWSVPVLIAVALPTFLFSSIKIKRCTGTDFLLAGTMAAIAFAFLFSPDLGMPRDADILTIYCIPASFWVLLLWVDRQDLITPAITTACLFAGLSTVGMQIVNQGNEDASLLRFNSLLRMDPERSAYGYEVLGMHYRRKGDIQKEENAYLNAVKHEENERYFLRIGQIVLEKGDYLEAEDWIKKSLEVKQDFALAYGVLGKTYDEMNMFAEADSAFQKAIMLESDVGVHYANYAVFLMNHDKLEEAGNVLITGLNESEENAQLYYINGLFLLKVKDKSGALAEFEKCRVLEPGGMWGIKAGEIQNRLMLAPSIVP